MAGRPKGSRNKASRELLWKLEKEHDFFVVQKIVDLYNEIEGSCKPLVKRAIENAQNGLSPATGFTEEEIAMLNDGQKNRWNILQKFLAYCYPKLKALEVGAGADHDQITFNINVPRDKVEMG
jgi:hypothetical protein